MEGTFKFTNEKIYEVIAISLEQKVFYAQDVSNRKKIEYFPVLDVSIKDSQLLKRSVKFNHVEGYLDRPDGTRYHTSRIDFI